jgi:hypothetical protein
MERLLICEHLDDEEYCRFHSAVLELITAASREGTILLTLSFSCKYSGYVTLLNRTYRQIQEHDWHEATPLILKESYHCYRQETENYYWILAQMIVSAHALSTYPEEKAGLERLIRDIKNVINE